MRTYLSQKCERRKPFPVLGALGHSLGARYVRVQYSRPAFLTLFARSPRSLPTGQDGASNGNTEKAESGSQARTQRLSLKNAISLKLLFSACRGEKKPRKEHGGKFRIQVVMDVSEISANHKWTPLGCPDVFKPPTLILIVLTVNVTMMTMCVCAILSCCPPSPTLDPCSCHVSCLESKCAQVDLSRHRHSWQQGDT